MAEDVELRAVEIMKDEVPLPKRSGGLYDVPIRLNRPPTTEEVKFLLDHWERPPQSTNMHRPDAVRVAGDRVVIEATMEEVRDYHKPTLELVLNKVNESMVRLNQKREQDREQSRLEEEEHRRHVEEVAKEIKFD